MYVVIVLANGTRHDAGKGTLAEVKIRFADCVWHIVGRVVYVVKK